jgi:hypothetical protein
MATDTNVADDTTEAPEGAGEAAGPGLSKAERAKLDRMGEAFGKIDRLLFRLAQQGLQRMSPSSQDELKALEQIAHNAALVSIERQIETLATHIERYLDKDPLFSIADYMATLNRIWLLCHMARKRHAAGETPDQMTDVIGEMRRSYADVLLPIIVQPLGASGWVTDTDFVGISIYFAVKDRPGVIYQASNCKPCAYFGRDPKRLLHDMISENVSFSIFDMAHGAYELFRAKLSSDGRLSLHKDLVVTKAPYLGARAYESIAVRSWSELVDRIRQSELHPVGGSEATLAYVEPALYGDLVFDEKNARMTLEVADERAAIMLIEVPLREENNSLVDNLEYVFGKKTVKNTAADTPAPRRRVAKKGANAGGGVKLAPHGLFGRAWVSEGRVKFFPFTALYNSAVVYKHDRRVNEVHLSLENLEEFSLMDD